MSDIVNRGSQPGDPTADTVREAFGKINQAFDNVDEALDDKVDKEEGKGLSTDDFLADGHYPGLRAGATTKDDVGLGNVENLTPEQLRAGVTKEDVGLGNVQNLTPEQIRSQLTKSDFDLDNVENYGIASEAEAQAGTADDKYMTPLRTAYYLNKRITYGTSNPDDALGDDGDLYFKYND